MTISSSLNNSLLAALTKAASDLVIKIKEERSKQNLPAVIDTAITQEPARATTDGASVDIVINLKTAPMAAAFEWGSGVHGKDKKTYVIKPREDSGAPFLAFDWPDHDPNFPTGKKFIGVSNRGKFLFNYVDHPGVAARPYITPAVQRELPEMKRIVGKEVRASILTSLKEINL